MTADKIDLVFMCGLGFLGSFGHCVGMCGNLTLAFALLNQQPSMFHRWWFHGLLNVGRAMSYALVGGALGGLGENLAGVGSGWRQAIAITTGLLLVLMGLQQVSWLERFALPMWHPMTQKGWHEQLARLMQGVARQPLALGLLWGLIPCGFLYTAQVKAIEAGSWWGGSLLMLAFGLGTLPAMVVSGVWLSKLGADRRSQLYRWGGWLTVAMGILTLIRTDAMYDFSGYGALLCLWLALTARPLSQLFPILLSSRRLLGVGAFALSLVHGMMMLDHTLSWDWEAVWFLLPIHQWGIFLGLGAAVLMCPAGLTSFDWVQQKLGRWWRCLHLLSVPALVCGTAHIMLSGSNFLGGLSSQPLPYVLSAGLGALTGGALLLRWRRVWQLIGVEAYYGKVVKARGDR